MARHMAAPGTGNPRFELPRMAVTISCYGEEHVEEVIN